MMIGIELSRCLKSEGEVFSFSYDGAFSENGFDAEVSVRTEFSALEKRITVTGTLTATFAASCARCLKDLSETLTVPFTEVFVPKGSDADDGESYTYTKETLLLDKMLYDTVMLNMPQRFLCGEDCKGLCQNCGQNLNDGQCDCKNNEPDDSNPFEKLKGLF